MRWSVHIVGLTVTVAVVSSAIPSSAPEVQCDTHDGECSKVIAPLPLDSLALVEGSAAAEKEAQNATGQNRTISRELLLEELGFWRIGIVLVMLGGVVLWILCTIKWAIDGSLPARLAMWGFLPEAYAAISPRAVVGLLRMKKTPTPAIVLRNCITDAGAQELADGIRKYPTGGVEVLEMPHNPRLGQEGVRALVSLAMEKTSELEELDFSYNPQISRFVPELLPLLPSRASKITTLRLMACGLNQADVQKLANSLKTSALKQLDLSLNQLTGAGQVLAEVCEAPILEEIMLKCCDLSAEDVGLVAENLPFTGIKAVQLGGNRFGRPGLDALVEHLHDCRVDELGLEGNELEAKDLNVLGLAWVKRPFARVKLNGNYITNQEINDFVSTLKTLHA